MRAVMYGLPILAVAGALGLASIFTVDERETALVVQFGDVRQVRTEPGLGFKVPLIQEVIKYDDRILSLATRPIEVTMRDDRRLVVDAFARWRITDPVRFREATGTAGITRAQGLLDGIFANAIPDVLGKATSTQVLSEERTALMNQIRDIARAQGTSLGIEVIDLRLTRTDLPKQNLSASFDRMRAERQREAADERARGGEAAQRLRAAADRTVVELTSEARKEAEVIRGQADAERNRIYAEAYGQDPEFFAFTRSLAAYERALQAGNTTFVLNPSSEFFDYLGSDQGRAAK